MPKRQTGARPLAGGAEVYDDLILPAVDQQPRESADAACYQAAVRLLAHRARTEVEMRQRLIRKGFEAEPIIRIITRLKESKLIDDAAFAHAWSESRTFSSPRASHIIRQELRAKGISNDAAEEAVAGLDDTEAALKVGASRAGRLSKLPPEEARRKLGDFLRRRGFSWEVIRQTLRCLEAEGLLGEVDT